MGEPCKNRLNWLGSRLACAQGTTYYIDCTLASPDKHNGSMYVAVMRPAATTAGATFRSIINRKHSHVHVLTIHHWFVRVCITSVVSKFTFLIQSFLFFYKVSALITLCICLNFYGNLYIYLFCWTTVMCAFVLLTVTGRSSTKTVLLDSTTSRNWKWPADISTIVMFLSATVNDKLLPI